MCLRLYWMWWDREEQRVIQKDKSFNVLLSRSLWACRLSFAVSLYMTWCSTINMQIGCFNSTTCVCLPPHPVHNFKVQILKFQKTFWRRKSSGRVDLFKSNIKLEPSTNESHSLFFSYCIVSLRLAYSFDQKGFKLYANLWRLKGKGNLVSVPYCCYNCAKTGCPIPFFFFFDDIYNAAPKKEIENLCC